MTAPELSPAELAVVERFEAAEPAPESLRERVAEALYRYDGGRQAWLRALPELADDYRRMADAAIAAVRGEES